MVFSSISFLYYFLPIVLLFYFILFKKYKNLVLLIFSLFFYFYGEPRYIFVLLFSSIFNYYCGKYLEKEKKSHKKLLLIINMIVNFGILFYFKYFNFFLDNINAIFNTNLTWQLIILPIGISFFTFQATSYIIDIYKGNIKSANNLLDFMTYLSLFPQLIAGPIVRYETIDNELKRRTETLELFSAGLKRFIIGLSKKVLIANTLGEFSKILIELSNKSILSYWFNAISDTLQIYFDFSGYSDMAIGLGLMFGFRFLENFDYPLISSSITEFWRRWHISLSSWFRDYLYIPLGGSRVQNLRKYLNIVIVWMATGLWHGASWNFILWGIYFAAILILEKRFILSVLDKHKILAHFYTIVIIIISFLIFNTENISAIASSLRIMFGFTNLPLMNTDLYYYLSNYVVIIIYAIIGCGPWIKDIIKYLKQTKLNKAINALEPIFYLFIFLITTAFIIDESFNPFLYFRF